MLLWASAQAVPASVEKPTLPSEWSCSPPSQKLCKYFEDAISHKRMKHRSDVIGAYSNVDSNNNHEPSVVKGSKNLHDRQVRSFGHVNKLAKNKYPHDKNTFVSYESAKTSFDFIRNISSLDDKVMNNGESVSVESISEATLATFKESDVKANAEKETSDKIYLHVNGSLKLVFVLLTVLGILIPIASIIYCFWTTRRSASLEQVQRRLADNDNNLLNQSLPDFEALMLSVQNLGCAGMERLGIPASTAMGAPLSSQRDDSRSIRRSTFPMQLDLKNSANRQTQNLLDESKTEPKSGIKSDAFESKKCRNMYTSCSSSTNCPPHIHRHDGEFGRDRLLNSSSQHDAEIRRNYIQAPPNKSIQDVPDATQPFHLSNSNRQLAQIHSKGSGGKTKTTGEKTKSGLFTFMRLFEASGGSSSSHKMMGNAENKLNSNTASMPRSQSSNVSTDNTSNVTKADCSELVLNGSTNYNLHSKSSYVNNNDASYHRTSSSPGSSAKSLKPSSSSSTSSTSSSSGPSPEHNNCL